MTTVPQIQCRNCRTLIAKDVRIEAPGSARIEWLMRCPECKAPCPVVIETLPAVRVSIADQEIISIDGERMVPKDPGRHIRTLNG